MDSLSAKIRALAIRYALYGAARLLPHVSDQLLLNLAKSNLDRVVHPRGRRFMERLLLLSKCVLPRLNPNVRKKFVANFFGGLWVGAKNSDEFLAREGFEPPDFIVISPTMRCNLKCYGCYSGQYLKRDSLDFATLDRILTEAKELGIYFVVLTGGEIFVRDDIPDLLEKHNDVFFMCYTNGTRLSDQMVEKLAGLGNLMPCISVEGFERETDDRRGKGTWKRILAAMDSLKEAGCLFGFSTTATRLNTDVICSDEFIDFFVEKGCFLGWYFTYIPTGRGPEMELMQTPVQRHYMWRQVNRLRMEKPIVLSDFWNDGELTGGCIAGGRVYLHINADGNVEPCVFIPFNADNIKEKSLAEVLKSDFFRRFRQNQATITNRLRPCLIIDHPHYLRDAVLSTNARPSYAGAESMVTDLAEGLDRYSKGYAQITDETWERYLQTGSYDWREEESDFEKAEDKLC